MKFILFAGLLAILAFMAAPAFAQCPTPAYTVGNDQTVSVQVDGPVVAKCYEPTGVQIAYDQVIAVHQTTGIQPWADHRITVAGIDSPVWFNLLDENCQNIIVGQSSGQNATANIDYSYSGQAFTLIVSGTTTDQIDVTWEQGISVQTSPTACSLATSLTPAQPIQDEWNPFDFVRGRTEQVYKTQLPPGLYTNGGRLILVQ